MKSGQFPDQSLSTGENTPGGSFFRILKEIHRVSCFKHQLALGLGIDGEYRRCTSCEFAFQDYCRRADLNLTDRGTIDLYLFFHTVFLS